MVVDQNPSVLFCQLATLEHAYAHTSGKITDQDIIGTIFGIVLKPSHLEAAMRKIWRQGGGSKGLATVTTNPKKQTEIVLTAFSGICYVCKERGHLATHCPNKIKQGQPKTVSKTAHTGKGKRFNGSCNHCGKQGHRKADCWELPENAAKKLSYLQGRGEQGNVHMDCDAVEFVLCTIDADNKIIGQKGTGTNQVRYCPSSLTQDEYNDLYGDVIITAIDEENNAHKIDEENYAHKIDEENNAHKIDEENNAQN